MLRFALEVEKLTTRKKSNLILNVDGTIGCAFTDLLRYSGDPPRPSDKTLSLPYLPPSRPTLTGHFTPAEAAEYLGLGCLNGLFVLGRSIGALHSQAAYLPYRSVYLGVNLGVYLGVYLGVPQHHYVHCFETLE